MKLHYAPLLTLIARGESGGNSNAYFGHAANQSILFTTMTIGEVLAWQQAFIAQGNASSAVGKYQFIEPTLRGLVTELHFAEHEHFTEALQDRLAIRLLERRGVVEYFRGLITREEFAHNLSKEWAALPRVLGDHPSASYYDGDGLNASQVEVSEVLSAIDSLGEVAKE